MAYRVFSNFCSYEPTDNITSASLQQPSSLPNRIFNRFNEAVYEQFSKEKCHTNGSCNFIKNKDEKEENDADEKVEKKNLSAHKLMIHFPQNAFVAWAAKQRTVLHD